MKKTIIISTAISILVCSMFLAAINELGWLKEEVQVQKIEKTTSYATNALYTADENGELVSLDFAKIAERTKDAVVHITSTMTVRNSKTYNPLDQFRGDPFYDFFFSPDQRQRRPMPRKERKGTGSGVIISEDGYIITNHHVIKGADKIEITLLSKKKYIAKVIGTDPTTDIALLKIEATLLPTLSFFDSDAVRVGEWVMAVGNPFNLNSTVTAGIVSAKGRNIHLLNERNAIESFIQTDAAINPGNSGGALVNLNGELLGINTAIASPTGSYAGYGFAVPSNIVKKVIDDLMNFGIVQRGFLGIMIREVNSNLASEMRLKVERGVLVDSLISSSAAADAGVITGDVIIEIDGAEVNSVPQLQELIARKRPGDPVILKVDRFGKKMNYTVSLNNKHGNKEVVELRSISEIETELGAEFVDIDIQTLESLNLKGGVSIKSLRNGKIRQFTNVKPGFIITKIDKYLVKDRESMLEYLKGTKGGILIEGRYPNRPALYYFGLGM